MTVAMAITVAIIFACVKSVAPPSMPTSQTPRSGNTLIIAAIIGILAFVIVVVAAYYFLFPSTKTAGRPQPQPSPNLPPGAVEIYGTDTYYLKDKTLSGRYDEMRADVQSIVDAGRIVASGEWESGEWRASDGTLTLSRGMSSRTSMPEDLIGSYLIEPMYPLAVITGVPLAPGPTTTTAPLAPALATTATATTATGAPSSSDINAPAPALTPAPVATATTVPLIMAIPPPGLPGSGDVGDDGDSGDSDSNIAPSPLGLPGSSNSGSNIVIRPLGEAAGATS